MKKLNFTSINPPWVRGLLVLLFAFGAALPAAMGQGETCATAINVASVPFSDVGTTTCGKGDDYGASPCNGSYMGGDDIVYTYTPATNQTVNVAIANSTQTWTGIHVLDGCPDATPSCVGSATSSAANKDVDVTLTAGTTYYIVVSTFPSPQCITSFDLVITAATPPPPPPPGSTCATAINVASVPFSDVGTTTCGQGDDYGASPCNGSYMGGDDIVYTYTPATNQTVNVAIANSTDTWTGIHVLDGCPDATPSCVGSATSSAANKDVDVTLTAGTTYYIVVSTFPSPQCITSFDLVITAATPPPPPPPGSTCATAINVASVPFSDVGTTTCGQGDDYGASPCSGLYMGGDDIVYTYTPATNQTVNVAIANSTDTWTGIHVLDGCPDATPSCVGSATSSVANKDVDVTLTAGTTYYIVVSTFPSPQCITSFDLVLSLGAEINLQGNGVDIASGDVTPDVADHTDFGAQNFCTPTSITRQFTIQNTGGATLNLTGSPIVDISGSSDFAISAQPTATVTASGSVTFDVEYTPTAAGLQTAVISIANSDSDEGTYTFTISGTGVDTTDPVFSACPGNINLNASASCDAVATWAAPTATDDCGTPTITSTHNSGATFPLGTTTVTYTATDGAGNAAICSFDVIVVDLTGPVISGCPGSITQTSATPTAVSWTAPTATDNCTTANLTSTHNSGDTFPVGTTTVTYTATDATGNTSTCSFNITIGSLPPPPPVPPLFPATFIAAYAQDTSRIEVVWLHPAPDEQGFYLYRAEEDGDYNIIATVPPGNDTIRYMDTGLDADKHYHYYVRAYQGTRTSAHSDQAEDITFPHTPTVSNVETCYGTSATFLADGPHRSGTYRWYTDSLRSSEPIKGGGGVVVSTATYQTGNLENDSEVWVRAMGRRYQSWPAKAVASLKPLPIVTLLSDANISSCSSSEVLAIQEVSGASYQWYRGVEAIAGATSATYEATANNRYRVQVNLNGCIVWSDYVALSLNREVEIFIEQGQVARFCDAGMLSATDLAGATYEWRKGGTTLGNTRTLDVNESGVYELIANDGACEVIREITVEIPTFPADLSLTSSGNDLCPGEEATLSVSSFSGEYNWLRNGRFFTSTDVPTLVTSTPGEYTVEFVSGLCTEQSASFTLNVNDVPQVRIKREGEELVLRIEGQVTPTSITWFLDDVAQPSLTGERIAPTQTGVYRAELTFGSCPTSSSGKYFAPSAVTDLEDQPELEDKALVIYPNPTPDALFVQLPQLTGNVSLELVDNLGRSLQRKSQEVSGAATLQLNLKGLPAGTYLLKIHHEELGESLHKIVKE